MRIYIFPCLEVRKRFRSIAFVCFLMTNKLILLFSDDMFYETQRKIVCLTERMVRKWTVNKWRYCYSKSKTLIVAFNYFFLFSGGLWQKRRKILTPAFHFGILKDFVSIFKRETDELVKILNETNENVVNVLPLMSQYTLRVIAGNF